MELQWLGDNQVFRGPVDRHELIGDEIRRVIRHAERATP